MFGGLEVKAPEKAKGEKQEAAASAFSFLSTAPPAEQPAAVSSGFSFLNAGPSASKDDADEPVPAATSGFSFLAPTVSSEDVAAAATTTGGGGSLDAAEQPSATSFSFIQSAVSEVPPLASELEAASGNMRDAMSGFSFVASSGGDAHTVSTISRDSPAPSDLSIGGSSSFNLNSSSPSGGGGPMGTGISFGGAVQTKKPIKRRTRTAKIGAAANASIPTVPTPPRPPVSTPSAETNNNTLDAAVEASRRAEEFMTQKLKEQAKATSIPEPSSAGAKPAATDPPKAFRPVSDEAADDEDSVLQAALAAAQEAKELSKQKSLSDRMGLGGFFRARASPPAESNHSSASSLNMSSRPPAPSEEPESSTGGAWDRLRKEQEDVKRAMAERQLQMLKETKVEKEEEAVTSSFQPPISIPTPPKLASVVSAPAASFVPKQMFKPAVAPPAAPPKPSPKARTDMEVFQGMLKDFRLKVVRSMEEVTRLRQHRSGLLEERFVTLAKERLATQQKAQAEAQQMAAAEEEDFELADRMGTLIEGHERERVEFAAILENIGRALKELDSQKEEAVAGVTKCFEDIRKQLKSFQEKQESKETEDVSEAMRRFSAVSKQLSAEQERLQHDLKHLERDEELVVEERKELEATISEQAGAFEVLRDEAKAKLAEVEEEIEELRKLLQAKQKVAAELRTEAAGHDENILKVRVKFSRQLTRVQKKEQTLKDNREEWMMEKKSYETHREEHEARMKEHSEAMVARENLLEALNKEVEMAESFKEIVAKEIGFGVDPKKEGEVDNDLAQMQADVVKCEAAVTEAKELLKATSAALASLEEEVETLEIQLPVLEETKKEAAARRDFKGAGKASKEIKEASTRLKEIQDELLGEAKERKTHAELEVKKLEVQLEGKRKVAREQERESSVAAMRILADNIKRLVATKNSVCEDAKELSIRGVGAFVLDGQIKALMFEGRTYGEKYGGWDELMAEIGVDHPEEKGSNTLSEDAPCEQPPEESSPAAEEPDVPKEEEANIAPTQSVDSTSRALQRKKFRELTKRIMEVEQEVEAAAANEDFEKAAELDELLSSLSAEVQALDLSDEEMELAFAEGSETDEAEDVEPAEPVAEENVSTEEEPAEQEEAVNEDGETNEVAASSDAVETKESGDSESAGDEKKASEENGAVDKGAMNGDAKAHEEDAPSTALSEDDDL